MQAAARKIAGSGKTIGLVPTMGYLHRGHQSLIVRAAKLADVVIASVFVNPSQFGPGEDFKTYPRDEKGDIARIAEALGKKKARTAIVFAPKAIDIYPDDFETWVTVEKLSQTLEGKARPGHFRGVTTIVAKLFNITRPDVVVFGLKDYQQAMVLSRMTRDLGYPIKFVIAPTVREKDGLAMSSRNAYLDDLGRWEATCLYYSLRTAREMVRSGVADTRVLLREMKAVIKATCPSANVDYIAFTDFKTLKPVKTVTTGTICSLAVRVHGVRLIDNLKLA